MNEIARTQQMTVGLRPTAIIPQSMDDAFRLGKAICLAGMAPKGMDSPEKCMIAIMRGMEVGLTPMQALDKIAIVNGRPTIWGDGALGLVRGSGLCEWIRESLDGTGEQMVATCESKRRGEPESIKRSFSVVDAKKAGLWGKAGPWQQFPARMLAMRARAFCLRDGFADVLGGLYLKEELDNEAEAISQPRRIAPSPAAPMIEHSAPQQNTIENDLAPAPVAKNLQEPRRAPSPTQAKPEASKATPALLYDPEALRKRFEAAAKKASDVDQLNEAWEAIVAPHWDGDLLPPDAEDLDRLYKLRSAELTGEEGAEP